MRTLPKRQVGRLLARKRTLRLEPLEARQLLDAGSITAVPAADDLPWQNSVYRLDVNHDGQTTPVDALNIINRIRANGGSVDLPPPEVTPPPFYYDANGDNRLTPADLNNVVNGILAAPAVVLTSLTPFTADVTPLVTVTATGSVPIPDDTAVYLDVDLNDDGDFSDPGELAYTQSTLFDGSSTFAITPGLARVDELYTVGLRARLKNSQAVPGTSALVPLGVDTIVSDALANYVNAPDPSYTYSLVSADDFGAYTYYVLQMTSQTWRSIEEVNIPEWRHWVGVYVPNGEIVGTALLLINGGSNTSGPPDNSDANLGLFAAQAGTVVVNLTTIPNEPVIFADDNGRSRTEDEIIAYTFDKYIEHLGEPGNETWPLLLPMVKSVVRAMDTVQTFVPSQSAGAQINDFVVFGGSKRGWTTWLTAAVDDRVRAIIPGVIDVLNIPPQMVHHYNVYGFFSQAIFAYEEMQIFERMLTPAGRELFRIVDPYRYLFNGRFDDMPKFVVNSAGDEFFVVDAAQFYYDDIPGDQNRLRYLPNTGHGLEENAVIDSVLSFYTAVLLDVPLPEYSWTVDQSGKIIVQTSNTPSEVKLWQATNNFTRDFRHVLTGDIWTSTDLVDQGGGKYIGDVPIPIVGATAYFVELTFPNAFPTLPAHVFTTEIRVKSPLSLYPWPFDPGTPQPLAVPATVQQPPAANVAASAIALTSSASLSHGAIAMALAIDTVNVAPSAEEPAYVPLPITDALVSALIVETSDEHDLLEAPTDGESLAFAGEAAAVDSVLAAADDELPL